MRDAKQVVPSPAIMDEPPSWARTRHGTAAGSRGIRWLFDALGPSMWWVIVSIGDETICRAVETLTMDATRTRRTKDRARQAWYAKHRQRRFARFLGFTQNATAAAGCRWRQADPAAELLRFLK